MNRIDRLMGITTVLQSKKYAKNKNEEETKRQVEPIGLIFYAFSWHLVAWCHKRLDYRDFKISRIQTMHNTSLPFKKAEHIALADYMSQLPVSW